MAIDLIRAQRPSTGESASTLRRVDIEVSQNGGFSVRCQTQPPAGGTATAEPALQTFATLPALLTFMRSELGR